MRDVDRLDTRAGRMRIPRSRGAMSGLLLVIFGLWGALIPFVGPYIDFAYEPNTPWMWTTARGWLEILPGGVTVWGGLLLLFSANRATALLGGWLAVVGGAWFVVGRVFATPLGLGEIEAPAATTQAGRTVLELAFFTGLGSVIIAIGGMAVGRLSVRTLRDIRYAQPVQDEYHRADYDRTADREHIAHERAAVAASDDRMEDDRMAAERPTGRAGERKHRSWRDMMGGPRNRPLPH